MPRHSYRRRSKDSETFGGLAIVIAAIVVITYEKLPTQTLELVAAGVLLLVVLIIGLVLFLYFKRIEHEKQKLQVLSMVDIQNMDGLAFESPRIAQRELRSAKVTSQAHVIVPRSSKTHALVVE